MSRATRSSPMPLPRKDERLAAAVERLRIADSFGIEWGNLLRDADTDPQMAKDCVLVVRAYLELMDRD